MINRAYYFFNYSDYNLDTLRDLLGRSDVLVDDTIRHGFKPNMLSKDGRCGFVKRLALSKRGAIFPVALTLGLVVPRELELLSVNEIVFVVYEAHPIARQRTMLESLKARYPQSKLVLIVTNIIGSYGDSFLLNMVQSRENPFDLVITFDADDAAEFGLCHYEGVYSQAEKQLIELADEKPKWDLYFCGLEKGRQGALKEIYDHLSKQGVSCRFDLIGGVETANRPGIVCHNRLLTHREMMIRFAQSRTILEYIACVGHPGSSLRPYEALSVGKKLLTNNVHAKEKFWYREDFSSVFTDPRAIDVEFVRSEKRTFDERVMSRLSPERLVEFMDAELF